MINQRQLVPGDTFSELQLAQQVKVSPVVVREFLLRFMRYDLLEPVRRGQWRMKNSPRITPRSYLNCARCWKPTP